MQVEDSVPVMHALHEHPIEKSGFDVTGDVYVAWNTSHGKVGFVVVTSFTSTTAQAKGGGGSACVYRQCRPMGPFFFFMHVHVSPSSTKRCPCLAALKYVQASAQLSSVFGRYAYGYQKNRFRAPSSSYVCFLVNPRSS